MGRCHPLFSRINHPPVANGDQQRQNEPQEEARREATEFTFLELANATDRFSDVIGAGSFGLVHRGTLQPSGQIIAVKTLNRTALQAEMEFRLEVNNLSRLRHPNLVKLIGFCAQGDQRLLIYEYMPLGSLQALLHGPEVMDWDTRMMIASDAAKGLNYLHNVASPPVIYRDLKSTNVLLGLGYRAKLSNFGFVKFKAKNDNSQQQASACPKVTDNVTGYFAPEYLVTGNATIQTDIYSFGVLLLELIAGSGPIKGNDQHELINYVRWLIQGGLEWITKLADIDLTRGFSGRRVCKAMEVTLMCLKDDPERRPDMSVVVKALDNLTSHDPDLTLLEDWQTRNPTFLDLIETGQKISESPSPSFEGQKSNTRNPAPVEGGQASDTSTPNPATVTVEEGQRSNTPDSTSVEGGQKSQTPDGGSDDDEEKSDDEYKLVRWKRRTKMRRRLIKNRRNREEHHGKIID